MMHARVFGSAVWCLPAFALGAVYGSLLGPLAALPGGAYAGAILAVLFVQGRLATANQPRLSDGPLLLSIAGMLIASSLAVCLSLAQPAQWPMWLGCGIGFALFASLLLSVMQLGFRTGAVRLGLLLWGVQLMGLVAGVVIAAGVVALVSLGLPADPLLPTAWELLSPVRWQQVIAVAPVLHVPLWMAVWSVAGGCVGLLAAQLHTWVLNGNYSGNGPEMLGQSHGRPKLAPGH